ncbi:chemotaxis protein CheB [Chryseobacterium nematophagum]|uniref:protein-glutamate methylesterase n=2 Tax=Chryseobacterium nematophagum TaxID=2305228 RepID=A0A3M7LED2_9FLAO|nr:chemotaxis protein CheB [Chryseobacterium nematophagum]
MRPSKSKTELMIIGGSAGSLLVILPMVKKLNPEIGFSIVLVIHRKAPSNNVLLNLLKQFSAIDVIEVEDKTEIKNNTLYIVPADYHVLFENKNRMSLDSSEKMNYSRPSIDVTFKSAAEIYGENLIGVLLSGANADGVEGLEYIKRNNGKVWVQDPITAEVMYMPNQAKEKIKYDLLITPDNFADYINEL